jgi:hypothetical protein
MANSSAIGPKPRYFASEQHTTMLKDGASRKVLSSVLSESVLRQCESAVEKLAGRYHIDAEPIVPTLPLGF